MASAKQGDGGRSQAIDGHSHKLRHAWTVVKVFGQAEDVLHAVV
jgi:hypothetical protein